MQGSIIRSSVFVLLGTATLAWCADTVPAPPKVPKEVVTARRAREMREKLAEPVSLEKGIDPKTPLRDAIEFIGSRYDLAIVVDDTAFKGDLATEQVEEQPVQMPKIVGVRLATILRMLVAQINGTYLVLADHVLITTRQRTDPESWTADRHLAPLVDAEFDRRPLEEALRELSSLTGINILLDSRGGEQGKAVVTATLNNAPLDTAVRLLAEMASLRAVAVDGALYVTDAANAERLEGEQASGKAKSRPHAPMPQAEENQKKAADADAKPSPPRKKKP